MMQSPSLILCRFRYNQLGKTPNETLPDLNLVDDPFKLGASRP